MYLVEQDDKCCISKMYKQHDAVYMAKHHRFGTKLDLYTMNSHSHNG